MCALCVVLPTLCVDCVYDVAIGISDTVVDALRECTATLLGGQLGILCYHGSYSA